MIVLHRTPQPYEILGLLSGSPSQTSGAMGLPELHVQAVNGSPEGKRASLCVLL